eukprot:gene5272-5938_t
MELNLTDEGPLTLQGRLPSAVLTNESFVINGVSSETGDGRPETETRTTTAQTFKDAELDVKEDQIRDDITRESLIERVNDGDEDAKFLLGQFYFVKKEYSKARKFFEEVQEIDLQAEYQLAVMKYDGLGMDTDYLSSLEIMRRIANCKDPKWSHLVPSAQYILGRAFFEGFGVAQSDSEAERWWLLAAKDGDPDGSVEAQTTLAMFYSRIGEDSYDMQKAYFWHQEATGNGSLESQAALGVMYNFGLGISKNANLSYQCFKQAADRGNIYAIGNLSFYYYRQKLYNNAVDFSQRVICITDADVAAEDTGCLLHYVKKGIALGCFIYGRCLYRGFGTQKNKQKALEYYSKAASVDIDVAHQMQELMIQGYI